MRRKTPKRWSIEWRGFKFVPFTARQRFVASAVYFDTVYAYCGNKTIAVPPGHSLLSRGEPSYNNQIPRALRALGLITSNEMASMEMEEKDASEIRDRRRRIRDLRDALDLLEIAPSKDQAKMLEELNDK